MEMRNEQEIDALFARLEGLMGRLVEATDAEERVNRSVAATHVIAVSEELHAAQALLDSQMTELVEERRLLREALDAKDQGAAGFHGLKLKQCGEQIDFAKAPVQRAEQALAAVLAATPFDTVEEARAALLPEDECSSIASEVAAIREEYARVFNECQQYA